MGNPETPRSLVWAFARKWIFRLVWTLVVIWLTLVIGGAFEARWLKPDLSPWHRTWLRSEMTASEMGDQFTLAQYLEREERLFAELRERIEQPAGTDLRHAVNRYFTGSRSHPSNLGHDWNRTFEVVPGDIRGGALLVHGLTDAPYSMRAIADTLSAQGYYALAMRMPGHGTIPSGLVHATWEDWMAAVRVGVRHVRARIGPDKPVVLVGYSNGGALVVKYALDVLDGAPMPAPTKLVLVSPMIGVARAARLARAISLLGPIPYFEKARWLDVVPEYNPFKYNSFPANAGRQTYLITTALYAQVRKAAADGRIGKLPPILTFQSIVDATVSTPAVVRNLYDLLAGNGSELVLFDINRFSGIEPFIRPSDQALIAQLFGRSARRYHRTLITNATADTREVAARSVQAGSTDVQVAALGMSWPRDVFSLTHVALPFTVDDPVYGTQVDPTTSKMIALGQASPRGEKAVLTVPVETLMRMSSNPFFPYLARRIEEWVR